MPAGVSAGASPVQASFLTQLQILIPHYYDKLIQRYGSENYTFVIEALGLKERVTGQTFFHFENRGKLHASVVVNTTVNNPAPGADVTITISPQDHYNSGTQSPLREGEVVRIDSSGLEAKIIQVITTTPGAHQAVLRPLKNVALTSAGSTNLLAGEVLTFMGVTEAGENSSQVASLTNLVDKFTNTTTEIRDDWTITDRAMMEKIYFEINGGYYYTYKGLDDMVRRFMNNREFKLMMGDVVTNTNLASVSNSLGTQGLIPRVLSDGQVFQYTPGNLTIQQIQAIVRGLDFYGGAQEYHWLCDAYQYDELMNQLFQTYNGGGVIWDYAGGSEEAATSFGFKSISLGQGYVLHFKKYKPFNSESVWGRASSNSKFRNFGILIPMKQWTDPVRNTRIPTLRVVYNAPEGQPEIISVETGMFAKVPTNNNANLTITNICYAGIEVFAANQYVIVTH